MGFRSNRVKKGYDQKDGRIIELKFTSKLKEDWSMSQSKQISNVILALSTIPHPNILKYPQKNELITLTVSFVLEHPSGGKLFYILYYVRALSEVTKLAYSHQLIKGSDIKPPNLLLDANFQLKVVDCNLHMFASDREFIMKTLWDKGMSNTWNVIP